jgi:hypothetical protein
MALVRYFVIVLVDLLAHNDHLEQIVVRIKTIDLRNIDQDDDKVTGYGKG